jgi:ABC-type methionine transport system ATPase subunit
MAKRRIKLTFPPDLITQPLIWRLGKEFDVVTNIRRANVEEKWGWVVLELEGTEGEMARGLDWIAQQGVRVEPVTGDVVAG